MRVARIFKSIVITVLIVGTSFAQQPENTDQASQNLKVDVQLVQLPVAVIDRDGRGVRGLNKENFDVFEDGVQQAITFFKQEDIPVSVGLVIDNSASMYNKRQRVNAAALAFARESNPEDETFVVDFDDQVFLQQDFTS